MVKIQKQKTLFVVSKSAQKDWVYEETVRSVQSVGAELQLVPFTSPGAITVTRSQLYFYQSTPTSRSEPKLDLGKLLIQRRVNNIKTTPRSDRRPSLVCSDTNGVVSVRRVCKRCPLVYSLLLTSRTNTNSFAGFTSP